MTPSHAPVTVRTLAKRWTGANAGRAIELRHLGIRGADAVTRAEGNTEGDDTRESQADPAESKNQGMYRNSMRENREVPLSPMRLITARAAQGRPRPQA